MLIEWLVLAGSFRAHVGIAFPQLLESLLGEHRGSRLSLVADFHEKDHRDLLEGVRIHDGVVVAHDVMTAEQQFLKPVEGEWLAI